MEFKQCHPLVNLIYFCGTIGMTMCISHPFGFFVSVLTVFCFLVMLKGFRKTMKNLLMIIPLMILTIVVNPLLVHEGVTILAYLPGGRTITLESIRFGVTSAVMLGSVILWFSSFNEIMTSEKLMYLFGKLVPTLSLAFSMILRFVPMFIEQYRNIEECQKALGFNLKEGTIARRFRLGTRIISAMMTNMLESSVETSNSMKSRGFEHRNKSKISLFWFSRRDVVLIVLEFMMVGYVIAGCICGALDCVYYPSFEMCMVTPYTVSVIVVYFLLCLLPILLELWGRYKWKLLK